MVLVPAHCSSLHSVAMERNLGAAGTVTQGLKAGQGRNNAVKGP